MITGVTALVLGLAAAGSSTYTIYPPKVDATEQTPMYWNIPVAGQTVYVPVQPIAAVGPNNPLTVSAQIKAEAVKATIDAKAIPNVRVTLTTPKLVPGITGYEVKQVLVYNRLTRMYQMVPQTVPVWGTVPSGYTSVKIEGVAKAVFVTNT